ncbi:MAG: hypothetical protein ACLFNK_01985 [Candidatus Woesearchaeota archaeon]
MHNIFLVPNWFLGYDIIFEIMFVLVTFMVAMFSFKVYGLTRQSKPRIFAIGFMFMSSGYLIQVILNSAFFFHIKNLAFSPQEASLVLTVYSISVYAYTYLMLIGLITLAYMSFNINKIKVHLLISLLVMMVLVSSTNKLLLFYIMSAVISLFIVHHYLSNYIKNQKGTSLLVLLGFLGMMVAYVLFIFSLDSALFYFIGHAVKLFAYILILINLIHILRKSKKHKG